MMEVKPKNAGKQKLFERVVFEQLTRSYVTVPTSILVLYAIALFYRSPANTALTGSIVSALLFAGWLNTKSIFGISFPVLDYIHSPMPRITRNGLRSV